MLNDAPVIECYGTTESCGGLTCTFATEQRAGIVGGPLSSVKLKLVDRPELGYLTTDDPPRGEVYIKGNTVFKGYFRRADLTQEVMTEDGWLKLGDIATYLPDGSLKLIDRAKNILKT